MTDQTSPVTESVEGLRRDIATIIADGVGGDISSDTIATDIMLYLDLRSALAKPGLAQTTQQPHWRHKKCGSIVTEVARGHAQCATRPICEMAPVVIYEHDGRWWVRHVEEFDDGRFEALSDTSTDREGK
jgi:hypothetical protein